MLKYCYSFVYYAIKNGAIKENERIDVCVIYQKNPLFVSERYIFEDEYLQVSHVVQFHSLEKYFRGPMLYDLPNYKKA